jgi:hypothetical protein|tara:strand:+ start:235 stop:423 length:189 start_codon:yes stop_codon:yes gene_type:complete
MGLLAFLVRVSLTCFSLAVVALVLSDTLVVAVVRVVIMKQVVSCKREVCLLLSVLVALMPFQ